MKQGALEDVHKERGMTVFYNAVTKSFTTDPGELKKQKHHPGNYFLDN